MVANDLFFMLIAAIQTHRKKSCYISQNRFNKTNVDIPIESPTIVLD